MHKRVFVYPGSDLDRSRNMLAALGSFWSRIYEGSDQVTSYVTATALLANQTYLNLLEVVAATSRYDVPLFHTEYITPIVLKRSEQNTARTTITEFDNNSEVFDSKIRFDVPPTTELFSFPIPAELANVMQVFNRITFPTAVLTKNVDFIIDRDRHAIVFRENPFDNPSFLRRPLTDAPEPDEEITLWGFRGEFDYDFIFEQFAYAISLKLQTSQGYKDLTNAIIGALIEGGITAAMLDAALAAICGVPVSLDPKETVEVVETDNNGLFIATDKHVYRFATAAIPRVEVEQVITAGTQLVQAVEINEFVIGNAYTPNNGEQRVICCPAPNSLLTTNVWEEITTEISEDILLEQRDTVCPARRSITAMALDSGFLSSCFYGNLVFENKVVPLEVDTGHPSGHTFVKFRVGGLPADVERFFDEIHVRGVLAAQAPPETCAPGRRKGTLANLLDKRVNPSGKPGPEHLPKNINPLRFLIENVLRNNVFIVRILVSALGQNRLGLYNIRQLRQLLPPQTAMITIFELGANTDKINAENQISDAITYFRGMAPASDTIPVSLVQDLGATARLISGTCQ